MTLPAEDPNKADKWWYFAPILFSLFGGLIGYFVWRKSNPKFAKKLLIISLILIIPHAIIGGALWGDDTSERQEPIPEKFQPQIKTDNKIQSSITTNQKYFIDTTGYTPNWAKSIGSNQALNKCVSVVLDNFGSRDSNWCSELSGFMMDQWSP